MKPYWFWGYYAMNANRVSTKNKIRTLLFFAAIVLLLLLYNDRRINHLYIWGLSDKFINVNIVPFKGLTQTVIFQHFYLLLKVLYFTIIGGITRFALKTLQKDKLYHYLIVGLLIVVVVEIWHLFTASLVTIDMNNVVLYLLGLALGYALFAPFAKLLTHCKLKLVNILGRWVENNRQ